MNVLVVGGAGSGKSAFAERLACKLSEVRTYVATMENTSTEARSRIARHQAQRSGMGFVTLECPRELPHPTSDRSINGVALLEDLGNLVANTLFAADGSMATPADVLSQLERQVTTFAQSYTHVVAVGNEVGAEGMSPYETTAAWVELTGTLNCRLATWFDVVVEVVAGTPCVVKGALP